MPLATFLTAAAALCAVLGWSLAPDVPQDRAAGDWPLAWLAWAVAGVLLAAAVGMTLGRTWGG